MAEDALIGYSGFVGGNLVRQRPFQHLYNSKNIDDIVGKSFDLLVFSGIQAKKWWANANPEEDWAGIEAALTPIGTIEARQIVLISTIDVLPQSAGAADETFDPSGSENHPYGRHRFAAEQWFRNRFANVTVVRLPGLFGAGLKKNVIYDLLCDNQVEKINPDSAFQYFDLAELWASVERTMAEGIGLIHLVPEPVATSEIIGRFFPDVAVGAEQAPVARYDFRTAYNDVFEGPRGYIAGRERVLEQLDAFIAGWRQGENR